MAKYLDLAGLTAYDKKIKEWFKAGVVDITNDAINALFVTVAEGPADNEIWYTTSDGNVVTPYGDSVSAFGANIVSNTYENGKGIIKFDNSVTSIGGLVFAYNNSLTSINIPNSVARIGTEAFSNCSSLTSIVIGNGVKSIEFQAFNNCFSLTTTNYTGDIVGWCNIEFDDPSANPMVYSQNFYINDQEIKDLVIPNSVDIIHNSAFNRCTSLTSVTIPNSVTSIGSSAFDDCSSLTSVTIPNSVTSIGEAAFRACSSLTAITIPNSVTRIRDYAFASCSSITSITFEGTMTEWNAITKGSAWNAYIPTTYVQCSDGQVEI